MRFLTALLLVLSALAGGARAGRVEVKLPADAALEVVDGEPPAEGPRISCPPTCVHTSPGKGIDIFSLKVEPEPDPRIGDRPWDIVSMSGCRGTSALPADNGICFLPAEGNATVSFEVRYRPILAVTVGGAIGGPLAGLFITGGPGPDYQGSGSSLACNAVGPTVMTCARHLSANQPMVLSAPSTGQATLVSRSEPCGGAGNCEFTLTADTCIAHLYTNGLPLLFPTVPISGPECPTGPGVGGGGGGGGPPPELQTIKDLALAQMRRELDQSLYPCLTATTSVALFAIPGPGLIVGSTMLAIAGPLCQHVVLQLIELQKIYDDPPDFAFDTIAPIVPSARPAIDLPSCAGLTGAERRFCRRLGRAATQLVGKVQRVADVATALRITVERAGAAVQAGEAGALKRQLRAAGRRQKQIDAALAARTRAGSKLTALLGDVQTTATLTEAQHGEATTIVLGKLAEQGLAEADARTALGPALTPAAIDLLALLGRP